MTGASATAARGRPADGRLRDRDRDAGGRTRGPRRRRAGEQPARTRRDHRRRRRHPTTATGHRHETHRRRAHGDRHRDRPARHATTASTPLAAGVGRPPRPGDRRLVPTGGGSRPGCDAGTARRSATREAAVGEPGRAPLGGRYELLALLATGGMGQVWRAPRHRCSTAPVAVKVLRSEYTGDPTFLARFRAEAQHAAVARATANIAAVYDYGEVPARGRPASAWPTSSWSWSRASRCRTCWRASGRLDVGAHARRSCGRPRRRSAAAHAAGRGAPRRQARQRPGRAPTAA